MNDDSRWLIFIGGFIMTLLGVLLQALIIHSAWLTVVFVVVMLPCLLLLYLYLSGHFKKDDGIPIDYQNHGMDGRRF